MNSKTIKTGAFWLVVASVSVLLWQMAYSGERQSNKEITFSEFIREVEAGKIKSVSIGNGFDVRGRYKDNRDLHTVIPANYVSIYEILLDGGIDIEIKEPDGSGWATVLINASPFILLLAFWIFMMRQMPGRRPPADAGVK